MEPLYTLPGVFKEDAPSMDLAQAVSALKDEKRKLVDRVFVTDPDEWYADNYHGLVRSLQSRSGIKVRIPLSDLGMFSGGTSTPSSEAIALLRAYFSFADLIVFSPAPLWDCAYSRLDQHRWQEFSQAFEGVNGRSGEIYYNGGIADFLAWHVAMRPLIRSGKVAYLPNPSAQVHNDWESVPIGLPRLERCCSDDPSHFARNAFIDLYVEQLVSERLGFRHVLQRSSQYPIITSSLALPSVDPNTRRAHLVLKIRIPSIANASFEELWSIQKDEWLSFDAFRKSIQKAVDAVSMSALSDKDLDAEALRIQREIIQEPLARLEERLRRIEQIRRRKWGGYVLLSAGAVLVSALAPSMAVPTISALGAVSILKIMEAYFADVEKDLPLREDALFWLAQLRQSRKDTIV